MSDTNSFDVYIRAAIARACDRDPGEVTPDTPLQSLYIDSLRMVAIVGDVEREYDAQFSSDAIMEFFLAESVDDLVELIRSHRA